MTSISPVTSPRRIDQSNIWAKTELRLFEKRHPELRPQRVSAVDWKLHGDNIYDKITHWFEVIGKVLQDPDMLLENVYNMNETGVIDSRN